MGKGKDPNEMHVWKVESNCTINEIYTLTGKREREVDPSCFVGGIKCFEMMQWDGRTQITLHAHCTLVGKLVLHKAVKYKWHVCTINMHRFTNSVP